MFTTISAAALLQIAAPACPAAVAAAPGNACVATAHGVVLSPLRAEAERLAHAAAAGEVRFRTHFRRNPPRFAMIQDGLAEEQAALRGAGFTPVLPYLTPTQFEEAGLASVRRGAEAQAAERKLSAEASAAAVAAAEATYRASDPAAKRKEQDGTVVPHELGHLWFVDGFWPDARAGGGGHYGGPGPDWMDETAAILMEPDSAAADRRDGFERLYRTGSATGALAGMSVAELLDLPRFLEREHSAKRAPQILRREQLPPGIVLPPAGAGPGPLRATGIRFLTGEEARRVARSGLLFYLQSRVFADFLIDRAGDPGVFADITAAFGRGETMADWLAAQGARHKLPGTIAALDRDWRAWLLARFGPPALAPVGGASSRP